MKFRLTFEGEVPSSQSKKNVADTKMTIRKSFHRQLKRLWSSNPGLSNATMDASPEVRENNNKPMANGWDEGTFGKPTPLHEALGNRYAEFGYRFVPLVRSDERVHCGLEILFLRNDGIFSTLTAGDIDNRLKTIIDALKRPRNEHELGSHTTPLPDEDPFFVLLEDDELVSRVGVEMDELLAPQPNGDYSNKKWSKIVVDVEIKPATLTFNNLVYL